MAGLLALLAGGVLLPPDPLSYLLPATFACAVLGIGLAFWPLSRPYVPCAAAAVALVSLAVTTFSVLDVRPDGQPDVSTALWILLEPAVLAVFVYLPVRWAPPRAAVWSGGVVGVAASLTVHRYDDSWTVWEAVGASGMWMIPAVAVGSIAWYLRHLEAARQRAVSDARQQQRLDLAGDLHDFVAHDVSEIVAQAQAGRAVLATADMRIDELLGRIESAGLRALTSMDRTVQMLGDSGRSPIDVLADLPALVDRFRSSAPGAVDLELEGHWDEVPREMSAAAYRVAVEGLTNVRRHAGAPADVTISVHRTSDELRLAVTDNGAGGARTDRGGSGGLGLAGLAARVEALGGELAAAPRAPRGWQLSARFPLPFEASGDRTP